MQAIEKAGLPGLLLRRLDTPPHRRKPPPQPCLRPRPAPDVTVRRPPQARVPVSLDQPPARVRGWFDDAAAAIIPDDDGALATTRIAADAYARRPTAANTRRAYRAGVRAEVAPGASGTRCPACPPGPPMGPPFLAAERGRGRSVTTVELRRAARYLHFICGCAVPTAEAQVAETMAGMHRTAAETGRLRARKRAATAEILQDVAGITEGAVFRRIWTPPRGPRRPQYLPRIGAMAIGAGTVARHGDGLALRGRQRRHGWQQPVQSGW
jgi:hypothetical protein